MTQPGAAIVNEWSEWLSDIEGETTRVGASERGKRTSFKPLAGFANCSRDPEKAELSLLSSLARRIENRKDDFSLERALDNVAPR
jgi:hypothetical protein